MKEPAIYTKQRFMCVCVCMYVCMYRCFMYKKIVHLRWMRRRIFGEKVAGSELFVWILVMKWYRQEDRTLVFRPLRWHCFRKFTLGFDYPYLFGLLPDRDNHPRRRHRETLLRPRLSNNFSVDGWEKSALFWLQR